MNTEIWKSARDLIKLTSHLNVSSKKLGKPEPDWIERIKASGFDKSIQELYCTFNGFVLKWYFRDLEGTVNIMKAKHLFDNTKVELGGRNFEWYLDTKVLPLEGAYIPIDMFTDESSVGVFSSFGKKGLLYYSDSGASFYSLNIDINSYLKLTVHTRGIIRWPRLLIGLQGIDFQDLTDSFTNNIGIVNPQFDLTEFKKEYESYLTC